MKKKISIIIAILMVVTLLTACSNDEKTADGEKLKIVTTIFPVYDWTKTILGENADNVELTLLLDDGVDLHSFEPTTEDMITISECDLFVHIGGHSDEWVEDTFKSLNNDEIEVVNLVEILGDDVKAELTIEGMQSDHKHEHDEDEHEHDEDEHEHDEDEHEHDEDEHEHDEDEHEHDEDEHEHDEEVHEHNHEDEHVWLSLDLAPKMCQAIEEKLSLLDQENSELYQANLDTYIEQLIDLDKQYETAITGSDIDTVLFGDRFPFRYLLDEYSLDYYAAFSGCSAETEASFETIAFLTEKVNELSLDTVFVTESSDKKIAETIIASTNDKNQQIIVLDAMQSTTAKDVTEGATYIAIMQKNLEELKKAL